LILRSLSLIHSYLWGCVGVGFSYGTSNNYTTGDNETAINNYAFLVQFFKEYNEYSKNEFYISGESFAGNYIPELAWEIYNGNQKGVNPKVNV
jgi:serine carboxypeptidase-like clade 2